MAISQYHTHYSSSNEQNLTDSLIVEAIQHRGIDIKYIPRTQNYYDFFYAEDPSASFESATVIEMYPVDVTGFGGDGEMFTKFGLDIKDTATFIVSKSRFAAEFPDFIRPREGDLLFMPITNAILEIKYVDTDSPFFEQGKNYVYELKTELFEVSHEDVSTGDEDVDGLISELLNFDESSETDSYGNNVELEERVNQQTSFDPANPFRTGD